MNTMNTMHAVNTVNTMNMNKLTISTNDVELMLSTNVFDSGVFHLLFGLHLMSFLGANLPSKRCSETGQPFESYHTIALHGSLKYFEGKTDISR
jgi:hypothetical protein